MASTGNGADVGFVWLAADSPVTDPSKEDLSGRNALLLSAQYASRLHRERDSKS
jgi:hypothetical protein